MTVLTFVHHFVKNVFIPWENYRVHSEHRICISVQLVHNANFAYCLSYLCSLPLSHYLRPVPLPAADARVALFPQWFRRLCVSLWGLCTVHDETMSFLSLWDFPYSYVCAVHSISNKSSHLTTFIINAVFQTVWVVTCWNPSNTHNNQIVMLCII